MFVGNRSSSSKKQRRDWRGENCSGRRPASVHRRAASEPSHHSSGRGARGLEQNTARKLALIITPICSTTQWRQLSLLRPLQNAAAGPGVAASLFSAPTTARRTRELASARARREAHNKRHRQQPRATGRFVFTQQATMVRMVAAPRRCCRCRCRRCCPPGRYRHCRRHYRPRAIPTSCARRRCRSTALQLLPSLL